ncbi:hypothetical protein ACH5RR_021018 [Cinchona calisaya]|uniref:Replication factor A C-terminal domain-containing protein n=1 Tax=Cinchona calisaya TaxID=153742 RepID=A0ABD2ZG46_9GENT
MSSENPISQTNPRKRPITEVDKPTTVICTVVAIDHTNLHYRVCSVCEKTLPETPLNPNPTPTPTLNPSSSLPICRYCNFNNAFNPLSSGSKRLFRVLMSVATDTKVFVVVMFDRAAKVLFGCSADDFFDFAKIHPFAAVNAGKILEGEMLRVTLSKPKNGNAQHLRVASVVPLSSSFQPAIVSLRELYQVRGRS